MKKFIFSALFVFALVLSFNTDSYAQTMYFAEGVDNEGYAISPSDYFTISSSGGYLYVLTRLPYKLNCNSVKYVIYRNGAYDNTIYQDTERSWVWFWKEVTFYKSGSYTFYVYDCNDDLLTSGSVDIAFR